MKNSKRLLPALAVTLLGLAAPQAHAWNGTGHMVVADIAYDHLTPKTKAAVDALLQHQRDYGLWMREMPSGYTAFGQSVSPTGSTNNHYEWGAGSGYRSDGFGPVEAAPLIKVGARYYDPELGCFMSRDTDLSQSPYVYCDGDPINFSDPSGHKKKGPPKNHPTSGGGAPGSGGPGGSNPGKGGGNGGPSQTSGSNSPVNNGGTQVNVPITINFPSPDEVVKGIQSLWNKLTGGGGKGAKAIEAPREDKLFQYLPLSSEGE